jgi:conjugative relaxase-like TrwC/TraI family protein
MLFINHATDTAKAKSYFTDHLSRSDYYMRDAQEVVGEWHGRGAELLGLSGQVDKESYFKLCENIDPKTGEQLTARTKAERRVLYDFTFDAPKSVTLAYELGGDDRIMSAFRESVKETMGEMEEAMRVRVRVNNAHEDRASCNMIWGEFIHRTTRPVDGVPDPQLHCHAVAFNASFDPVEERWKAGEFGAIVRDKGYYKAAFHSRFAEKLSSLGYGIERDGNSFRLAGIERATTEEFSRRTRLIDAEAERLGLSDPKALRELGRKTREGKPADQLSMSELRQVWNARISDDAKSAIAAARTGRQTRTLSAGQAVGYAMAHCFERESAVTQKNLLKTALIQSVGNASVAKIREAASRDDVLQKDWNGQRYVTTRAVLREERDMVNFVRDGKATRDKLGGSGPNVRDANLTPEQQAAQEIILTSRDRVTALKGRAGTGKTRMMQATVAGIEKNGKQVFTFAPSAEAARGVLRSEGFGNAETVERLLIDPEMQKRVNGQVLWIDEARLLSVKDMKRLFDVAKEQNARVILAGDTGQHTSVTRGDALRILEKDAGIRTAELTTIRRQTNAAYREAVAAIAEGDRVGKNGKTRLEAGIDMLDRMGAIVEAPGEGRHRLIAEDYATAISETKHGGGRKTALVVTPTHKEAERVTEAIREVLKESGKLSAKEREFTALRTRNLTEAERGIAGNYARGEVVQFHQNAKGFKRGERVTIAEAGGDGVTVTRANGTTALLPLHEAKKFQVYGAERLALAEGDKLRITLNGFTRETRRGAIGGKGDRLNNGTVYEVDGFTRQGDIRLTNGFVVPKDYGGFTRGYVVTSHASQGKTVDKVLIALGNESFVAANRQQFYVSVSRGREGVKLYTDNKVAMGDAVRASSARLSATELMGSGPQQTTRKASMRDRLYRLHQAKHAYHRLRQRIAAYDLVHAYQTRRRQEGLQHGRY